MGFFKKLINLRILTSKKRKLQHSMLLFGLNFALVFVVGLIHEKSGHNEFYSLTISGIFFAAVISISDKHIRFLIFAIVLTILTWISTYMSFNYILHITTVVTIMFFVYIIVISVNRIARSKEVGTLEFIRSVNIYFLIGIVGAYVFRTIYLTSPSSFKFDTSHKLITTDLIYFSFETITTLGYGDITPVSPLAKNVSVLLAFSGQLYLTFIIALLIGKYLRSSDESIQKFDSNLNPK
jgi:hypothetical protein